MRSLLSVALAVAGALLLPFAVASFYAREQVVDPDAFAGRALTGLEEPAVRAALERELLVAIENRFGARALAEDVLRPRVQAVIASDDFRSVFDEAVLETRLGFLVREQPVAILDLGAAGPLVREELRAAAPQFARRLPQRIDVEVVLLRRDEIAGERLMSNSEIRRLGVVLPLLTMAAFAGSLAAARRRARGLIVVGMAVAVSAAGLGLGLALSKEVVVDRLESEGRLTAAELQQAAGALFDVFFDDLYLWALGFGVAGVALVAAGWALDRRG